MKEFTDEAPGLELSMPKDKVWQRAYYGNTSVPSPTNSAAKKVNSSEILRAVNEGK